MTKQFQTFSPFLIFIFLLSLLATLHLAVRWSADPTGPFGSAGVTYSLMLLSSFVLINWGADRFKDWNLPFSKHFSTSLAAWSLGWLFMAFVFTSKSSMFSIFTFEPTAQGILGSLLSQVASSADSAWEVFLVISILAGGVEELLFGVAILFVSERFFRIILRNAGIKDEGHWIAVGLAMTISALSFGWMHSEVATSFWAAATFRTILNSILISGMRIKRSLVSFALVTSLHCGNNAYTIFHTTNDVLIAGTSDPLGWLLFFLFVAGLVFLVQMGVNYVRGKI